MASAPALLRKARKLIENGRLIRAAHCYSTVLNKYPEQAPLDEIVALRQRMKPRHALLWASPVEYHRFTLDENMDFLDAMKMCQNASMERGGPVILEMEGWSVQLHGKKAKPVDPVHKALVFERPVEPSPDFIGGVI